MTPNNQKIKKTLYASIFFAVALFTLFEIWFRFNLFVFDSSGHLASASWFMRGYFHKYQDAQFLGGVHDLFYPPLEDALLGTLLFFVRLKPLLVFKIYLSILTIGYFFSVYSFGTLYRNWTTKYIFAFGISALYLAPKNTTQFQGLSFSDFLVVGLGAQVLGGTFMWLLLRELRARERALHIIALLSLAVLSHLIIGLSCLLLVAAHAVLSKNLRRLLPALFSLGLTAFFWLPFTAHKSFLVENTVISGVTPLLLPICALIILVFGKELESRYLSATSFCLLGGSQLYLFAEKWNIGLPRMHYYRFEIVGVLFLFCALLSCEKTFTRKFLFLTLFLAALSFDGRKIPWGDTRGLLYGTNVSGEEILTQPVKGEYGRGWVIEGFRPYDFSFENYLTVINPNVRVLKGLFWESSKSNALLGSYLSSLFGAGGVLNYAHYEPSNCEVFQCFFDHLVSNFNVRSLTIGSQWLSKQTKASQCLNQIVRDHGTKNFFLVAGNSSVIVNRDYYLPFEVSQKSGLSNATTEVIDPGNLLTLDLKNPSFFFPSMAKTYYSCKNGKMNDEVLVSIDEWTKLQTEIGEYGVRKPKQAVATAFEKVAPGQFQIKIDSSENVLFKIKLAPTPGLELTDSTGKQMPLFTGYPHLLGIGKGTLTLGYHRTLWMKLGYWVSLLTFLFLGFRQLRQRL